MPPAPSGSMSEGVPPMSRLPSVTADQVPRVEPVGGHAVRLGDVVDVAETSTDIQRAADDLQGEDRTVDGHTADAVPR